MCEAVLKLSWSKDRRMEQQVPALAQELARLVSVGRSAEVKQARYWSSATWTTSEKSVVVQPVCSLVEEI